MKYTYTESCSRFDVFEICIEVDRIEGNPFTDYTLEAEFTSPLRRTHVEGFYDGNRLFKVRYMPSVEGEHTVSVSGSFLEKPLSISFSVGKAKKNAHGPVHVQDTYHFAYEDGTPYVSVGTTCYVWHLQSDACIEQTLASLEKAGFNKIRFCIFPKHYVFNLKEPRSYPYEGTPMDSSVLTEENFMSYTYKTEGNHWDFTRFCPEYFQHIEYCIRELGKRGIEADLILMHPYDRWGFSCMPPEANDLYYHYVINRFASFANVWWSLANEYDLFPQKTMEDWEHYAQLLVQYDPYGHLRSIHNCRLVYDHSRSWVTHVSYQRVDLYKGAELTDELRTRYGKPVVNDEIAYEGNIQHGWGNITGQEMLRRFYETAIRGGYPGHSETYLDDSNLLWWSHGGTLHGESWKRFAFLKQLILDFPRGEIAPLMNEWDSVSGVPETEWFLPVKSMYLYYYSFMRPSFRDFYIDDTTRFRVEVIDTWECTIEDRGICSGHFRIDLPARQYMAVRLTKVSE